MIFRVLASHLLFGNGFIQFFLEILQVFFPGVPLPYLFPEISDVILGLNKLLLKHRIGLHQTGITKILGPVLCREGRIPFALCRLQVRLQGLDEFLESLHFTG